MEMKTLTTILLIFTSYFAYAQFVLEAGKATAKEPEFILMQILQFDSITHKIEFNYEPKSLRIRGDTVKAILYLLKQLNTQSQALIEAENVLSNIRTDGYVTNWKAFYKAVDRYKKVKDYNAVMKNHENIYNTLSLYVDGKD